MKRLNWKEFNERKGWKLFKFDAMHQLLVEAVYEAKNRKVSRKQILISAQKRLDKALGL